jgi:bacterioferritin-associated ferredoxin
MYVCVCNAVTEDDVRDSVLAGACSTRQVRSACGMRPGCGICTKRLRTLVSESIAAPPSAAEPAPQPAGPQLAGPVTDAPRSPAPRPPATGDAPSSAQVTGDDGDTQPVEHAA